MSGKSKPRDSYCSFRIVCKYSLSVSSYCMYHDKTSLKCYIQKPARQAGQESRMSPAAVSLTEVFMNCHRGELLGTVLQTSSRCHTSPRCWCSSTMAALAVQHWCAYVCLLATPYRQSLIQLHFHLCQVCHLLTFQHPVKICWFCSACHVRRTLHCCWPWGSHGEQASDWHCFVPGRQAGERSWMAGCTPSKGPRSESFYDSGGIMIWTWEKPGHQGWPASWQVPALLPTQGCWGRGEKMCRSPLCKKGRLLPPSLGVQCDRKRRILILIVLTTQRSDDLLSALPWLCVGQLLSCPLPQFWKPHIDLLCDLLTHQTRAQGGSKTPGCILSLETVGADKPLLAQGAQVMFLLYGLVLPKVLPPQLQRWWWKAKKWKSN